MATAAATAAAGRPWWWGRPERENKRPLDREGTVDALLLALTSAAQPALRRAGATPNRLTTASFACGLLGVVALWHDRLALFAVAHALNYVFDCLDGQFARRYGMGRGGARPRKKKGGGDGRAGGRPPARVTAWGDVYDHATDVAVYALLCVVALVRFGAVLRPADVAVLAVAMVLNAASLGCQQLEHAAGAPGDPPPPELLDAHRTWCPCARGAREAPDAPAPAWVSHFGPGNFTLFFIVYVVWLGYRDRLRRAAAGGA